MKQLLLGIADALEAGGKFKSVFITPMISDEHVAFPHDMKLPAAAIAFAGEEASEDGTAEGLTEFPDVLVGVFARTQERSPSKGTLEALELAEAVKDTLHRNLLERDYITLAQFKGAMGTNLVAFPSAGVATQITLRFGYELEEEP